jgi:hypothetical protein
MNNINLCRTYCACLRDWGEGEPLDIECIYHEQESEVKFVSCIHSGPPPDEFNDAPWVCNNPKAISTRALTIVEHDRIGEFATTLDALIEAGGKLEDQYYDLVEHDLEDDEIAVMDEWEKALAAAKDLRGVG